MKKEKYKLTKFLNIQFLIFQDLDNMLIKVKVFQIQWLLGIEMLICLFYPQLINIPYKLEKIAEAVKSYYEKYD